MVREEAALPATPVTRPRLETSPSIAPKTAGRSQPPLTSLWVWSAWSAPGVESRSMTAISGSLPAAPSGSRTASATLQLLDGMRATTPPASKEGRTYPGRAAPGPACSPDPLAGSSVPTVAIDARANREHHTSAVNVSSRGVSSVSGHRSRRPAKGRGRGDDRRASHRRDDRRARRRLHRLGLAGAQRPRGTPRDRPRVVRAAAEVGYVPNAVARSLKGGRTIRWPSPWRTSATRSTSRWSAQIQAVAKAAGYRLLLHSTDAVVDDEIDVLRSLADRYVRRADHLPDPRHRRAPRGAARRGRAPVVVIGSLPEGAPVDNVRADSAPVPARRRHLVATGRRRIGFVNGPLDTVPGARAPRLPRRPWRRSACRTTRRWWRPATSPRGGRPRPAAAAGRRAPAIDALFCANDLIALGASHALRAAGCGCPRTSPWSAWTTPTWPGRLAAADQRLARLRRARRSAAADAARPAAEAIGEPRAAARPTGAARRAAPRPRASTVTRGWSSAPSDRRR